MRLYSGLSPHFIKDNVHNRIAEKLTDAFRREFRHAPPPSEVASWRNSLRAISQVLDDGDFRDHGILLEYQPRVPVGAEPRHTHFWHKAPREYHIDHCFLPRSRRTHEVAFASRADCIGVSDDAPRVVAFESPAPGPLILAVAESSNSRCTRSAMAPSLPAAVLSGAPPLRGENIVGCKPLRAGDLYGCTGLFSNPFGKQPRGPRLSEAAS